MTMHTGSIFTAPLNGGGSYRLEYIYAEPEFPGYYQDKEYISGNFFFPIRKELTLNATIRQEKNNLDLDPLLESAALSRYGQIGLNYRFKTGTTISIESRFRTREDRLAGPDFDDRELTHKVRLGQSFKKLFFNVSAELGKAKDRLKDQTSDLGIYEGSFYFMPTHNQSYGSYVRYSTYKDPESEGRDTINTGLTGAFKIAKRANLRLKLDRYHIIGNDSGDRHNFDLALNYLFPNKSRISAHGRHTLYGRNSDQEDETAFIVEFTVPFGLPVGRKRSIGMLEGYVRDQETGQPIKNAILRLSGVPAVTDSDGEFTFPALKPGAFYLNIDSASIGLERIPVQRTPLKVDIEGGKETSIEIGITKSADLTGKVMVYEFAEEDGLQKGFSISKGEKKATGEEGKGKMVEACGLANVLLEFKSKLEIWRVLTDRKGRFRFDDVRPGQWTLTVRADNLPEYHYLEKDIFEIELAPGEKKEMLIRVLPRKRTIQIIEQGEILIEEEGK
ncbi:MSCRAMM family protein [Desulfobacula sp.]|uniref:MSCRAMM family protein n=1 Tax=Desulfobacula sp. TaxID=2593537 RepID=UPI0027144B53|nr:carboxypeptidase-like regulatory domain-containing protein [Desulfobacula sp.]